MTRAEDSLRNHAELCYTNGMEKNHGMRTSLCATLVGTLLLTAAGVLLVWIVRLVFVIFLGVAAYKAWRYGYINIPIASALVRKINKNYA